MRAFIILLLSCLVAIADNNLIPNSSFECGTENWMTYGSCCSSAFGNDTTTSGLLSTTNKIHGNYSLRAPRTRLYSQPIYLIAGSYMETFYMMSDSASTITNVICATDFTSILTNGCRHPTINTTTSWMRYTNEITVSSNGYYALFWYKTSPGPLSWIDCIQLETGTVATAWAPMAQVEIGLGTTNIHHMLRPGNPNYIQALAWNEGGAVGMTSIVQMTGFDNSNFLTTVVSTNSLPGGATTINVSLIKTGYVKATIYQPTLNNSWNELIFSVLPHPPTTVRGTNGVIGTHPSYGFDALISAAEAGYTDARSLSPSACCRWSTEQPNGTGPFTFDPYCTVFLNSNLLPALITLSPGLDNVWPTAATNAAGDPDTNAWYVYCYTNAFRYSPAPSNCVEYEIGNEWQGIAPFFSGSVSNTARFNVVGAQAVRAACPTCTIVVMSGENDAVRGLQIWTNMTNMTLGDVSMFNVISTHNYPDNAGINNPNGPDEDLNVIRSVLPWMQNLGHQGIPLWNSEMGNQGGKGGVLGPMMMYSTSYAIYGDLIPEAGRDWLGGQRKVVAVDRESKQVLRTLGVGYKKIFAYFGQEVDSDFWGSGYAAGSWEINGALKNGAVAALIGANQFARHSGLGRITNQTTLFLETYVFTNQLGTVLATWHSTNATVDMTFTNGHFSVWDVMGNPIKTNSLTLQVDRNPQYMVSGDMTMNQMITNFMFASVANASDVTGPAVSVDISPIGVVTNGSYIFKWTVVDRNLQAWSIGSMIDWYPDNTNNRSYIKFKESDPWVYYGETNFAVVPLTIDSQKNLFVKGLDYYNNFTTNIGPAFGILDIPSHPTQFNVSGTVTVGTITIAP